MNAYVSDAIAREHADRLMADARAVQRAHRVRAARRAAQRSKRARRSHEHADGASRPGAAAQFARPFVALHHWLVAGEM